MQIFEARGGLGGDGFDEGDFLAAPIARGARVHLDGPDRPVIDAKGRAQHGADRLCAAGLGDVQIGAAGEILDVCGLAPLDDEGGEG